jgi:putative ATPase
MTTQPLAALLRPTKIAHFYGQTHLLSPGKPLYQAIQTGQLHSMILWGPPGSGKTTLAHLLCQAANAQFEQLSAVLAGVKEIREVVTRAQKMRADFAMTTVLFVDEVHRFNKAQQDAFLPFVEDGTFIFIGATTENPSFALNNALLSRTNVYVLQTLTVAELEQILQNALSHLKPHLALDESSIQNLIAAADGDARRLLNLTEILSSLYESSPQQAFDELLAQILGQNYRRCDKAGDYFYDLISALHKSVRGSAPDAALYWLHRMLDGGCNPLYIARRLVRMASEDIGNADPRALELTLHAWQVQERLGSPEGELALSQAVLYLACAAKSNAVYIAHQAAAEFVAKSGSLDVPLHLRNAPTNLMKNLGYAKQYRYAHDEPDAYAAGENYFPEEMQKICFYRPVDRGLEIKIKEKLKRLQALDEAASQVSDTTLRK